jgi:hypothetical protein
MAEATAAALRPEGDTFNALYAKPFIKSVISCPLPAGQEITLKVWVV